MKKCVCCKTNEVGETKLFCKKCWNWITNKMWMGDVTVVLSKISHRKPKDQKEKWDIEYAKTICNYLVADNYTQGKAKLESDHPKCNKPLFINDHQTFYCGLLSDHDGQHIAMIRFEDSK